MRSAAPPVNPLTGRDYKRRSRGADSPHWRDFGAGVIVGAALAAALLGVLHRHHREAAAPSRPVVHHASPASTAATNAAANAATATAPTTAPGEEHYDFYQMLPHFEVVVPEKEHPVRPGGRAEPIAKPGVYVLQAGSYRDASEAHRVAQRLAQQGISAKVDRVSVDTDVWYRVRVGPITRLARLNRLRHKLEAAHVDALVIRIGG